MRNVGAVTLLVVGVAFMVASPYIAIVDFGRGAVIFVAGSLVAMFALSFICRWGPK